MRNQFPVSVTYAPVSQSSHTTTQQLIATADQIQLSSDIARYVMGEMSRNVETAQLIVSKALISTCALLTQTPQVGRSQGMVEALLFDFGQRMLEVTNQANTELVRLSHISSTPYRR
ncbi:MAG: hypothetical protein H0U76_08910 [Ktedonobacteraceae bacterium]|nr:hypothetical protein [Ktedonobacteraceae bacterium]